MSDFAAEITDHEIKHTVETARTMARARRATSAHVYGEDAGQAARLIWLAERLEAMADEIEAEAHPVDVAGDGQ